MYDHHLQQHATSSHRPDNSVNSVQGGSIPILLQNAFHFSKVYSELGRSPLYISRHIRTVKYWLKLLNTDNCILKQCYATLYDDCLKKTRTINWVSQVRDVLLNTGFGYIWYTQNVDNKSTFLSQLKQRMTDQFIQSMFSVFDTSPKCFIYKYMVNNLCLQSYLQKPITFKHKQILCKYRISAHSLFIETGRYYNIDRYNRICPLCNMNVVEDEYHFILVCPFYNTLRGRYIKFYYYNKPSTFKLIQLLSINNLSQLNKLCIFFDKATKYKIDNS